MTQYNVCVEALLDLKLNSNYGVDFRNKSRHNILPPICVVTCICLSELEKVTFSICPNYKSGHKTFFSKVITKTEWFPTKTLIINVHLYN